MKSPRLFAFVFVLIFLLFRLLLYSFIYLFFFFFYPPPHFFFIPRKFFKYFFTCQLPSDFEFPPTEFRHLPHSFHLQSHFSPILVIFTVLFLLSYSPSFFFKLILTHFFFKDVFCFHFSLAVISFSLNIRTNITSILLI